jgi:hypothetical protein
MSEEERELERKREHGGVAVVGGSILLSLTRQEVIGGGERSG